VDADRPALVDELLSRCELPEQPEDGENGPVTCAVSGGADSLALLVLARAAGFEATAVHVDHGLRAGSSAEAEVVAAAAARFGADFRAERVEIEPGPNLEARARAARYAVLPAGVLTGHTADDQAETVLLNLLRGSGLDGLAGMRAAPEGRGPRRPLLAIRRAETVALCTAFGLQPVADASNADPAHRRNRIRHELLPLAASIAERDVAALLARQSTLLRDEADLLDRLAGGIDPVDSRSLAAAPPALARRAVRRWLVTACLDGRPPDAATVDRVLAVARNEHRACDLIGGWRIERHRGKLSIIAPKP
jgi:tRNA(Ile)-lysidine synthase